MTNINDVLERHKEALLALPGCTAVAIGKKMVAGHRTDTDCIVVFVQQKRPTELPNAVPTQLEGIPTDVLERTFDFQEIATDPFARFDPLIGGIAISAQEDVSYQSYGSLGCFIRADGTILNVPAADYMLTNQHVLIAASVPNADRTVLQPGGVVRQPNYSMGLYTAGQIDATHDCAISTIVGRNYQNVVPNHPWRAGNRALAGIGQAVLNDRVYKYGATTKHTVGIVRNINLNIVGINNAILIEGENNSAWCDGGDSGSVLIRYQDDLVLGLNFRADTLTPVSGGYRDGLAYDITTQIQVFSTNVQLSP